MANVLTKGSVLTDNIFMQRVWAWTQCIAIDASVAGTIIRAFRYHAAGERIKTWLNGLLSALLLFTAAIVSNIESVQQTLNIALDQAYVHVLIPVEVLIWIRSIAIVLLIVAHALRHVHSERSETKQEVLPASPPAPLVVTPELLDALRPLLAQTTVSEEAPTPYALPSPQGEQKANMGEQWANLSQEATGVSDDEQAVSNCERVKAYLAGHPDAKVRDVAEALTISVSTANKWMNRIRGRCLQGEQREPHA
jgi:DNA-directed RNA polymerase specialized sigma24 family protein